MNFDGAKKNKKGGFRKHNGINERNDFLGSQWLTSFHWLFRLPNGGGIYLLNSYSYRSRGVDENLTSYIGYFF